LSGIGQPDFRRTPDSVPDAGLPGSAKGDSGESPGITIARLMAVLSRRSDGIFSLGAVLARYWHPAYPLLPWALTSAMLTVAAMWDRWSRGGAIDYVVLGLGAYELMLGLLEEQRQAEAHPDRRNLQTEDTRE